MGHALALPARPADRESAQQIQDLVYENLELQEKVEKWRLRARTLQEERWGFVQKWRTENFAASEASAVPDDGAAPAKPAAKLAGAPTAAKAVLAEGGEGGEEERDEVPPPQQYSSADDDEDSSSSGSAGADSDSDDSS